MATVKCPACSGLITVAGDSTRQITCPSCMQQINIRPRTAADLPQAKPQPPRYDDPAPAPIRAHDASRAGAGSVIRTIAASIAAVLLTVIAFALLIPTIAPKRWEYIVHYIEDGKDFSGEMNRLGSAGWDAISARRATTRGELGAGYEIIFKRQR